MEETRVVCKEHQNPHGSVLAIADETLIGKTLREGKIVFRVSTTFYHGKRVTEKELSELFAQHENMNIVGKESMRIAETHQIIEKKGIIWIEGEPHAQVYKLYPLGYIRMARPTPTTDANAEGRMRLPHRDHGELFAIITKMHGTDQIAAMCEDGIERHCRIPGKLKKRVWMREGDVIIVRLWDFQPIKGDVVWRYLPIQTDKLKRKGLLEKLPV
ncbi:MAG: translation initiation factor eIF-1A [archaeon]